MTSARNTLGTVFGMVGQTAATVTSAVTTISDGIDIAQKFIESAKQDQADRQLVHRDSFRDQLVHDTSMEIAERDAEALKYMSQSEDHKANYQRANARLSALFAPKS